MQEVRGSGVATTALEKFNGDNYHLWKGKAKMVLAMYDLWEIINGQETRPDAADDSASPEDKAEVKRQQIAFDKRSQRALAIIGLALRDDIFASQGIADAVSPADAWRRLADLYACRGLGNRLLLRQKFAQLKMNESDDVISFLNAVKTTAQEMAANGDASHRQRRH